MVEVNFNADVCVIGPLRPLPRRRTPIAGQTGKGITGERRGESGGGQGVNKGQLVRAVDVAKPWHPSRSRLLGTDTRHPTVEQGGGDVAVQLDRGVHDDFRDLTAGGSEAGADRLHDHGVLVNSVAPVAVRVDRRGAEDGARRRPRPCSGAGGVLHGLSLLEQGAVVDDAGDDRNEERGDHREFDCRGTSFSAFPAFPAFPAFGPWTARLGRAFLSKE